MLADDDRQKQTVQIDCRNKLHKYEHKYRRKHKINYKRNQLQNKTNYKTKPDQQRMPMLNNTTSIQNANTVGGYAVTSVCNGVNQL